MLDSEELKYKEFIRLQRRLDEIQTELRKKVNVKLDKPIQNGWTIEFDVKPEIKRRKDYPLIKELVADAYHTAYTKSVRVVKAIRSKDTAAIVKVRYVSHHISDYYPHRRYYYNREDIEDKIDKFRTKYLGVDTDSEHYKKYKKKRYYWDIPKSWLIIRVRANMITHRYLKGGDLEKERDYIYNKVWGPEFQSFFINYSKSYPVHKDRAKTRDRIRKFINGQKDDIFNERVPLEYDY